MPRGAAPSLSTAERLALASGIAFSLLQLLLMVLFGAFILPKLGAVDAPAVEKAVAYARHSELIRTGNYLLVLPVPFFLLFLGGLHSVLGRAEEDRTLALASVLSGAATAMLWPLAAVLSDIAILIAESGGDAATIAALDAIGPYTLSLTALGRVVLLGAAGTVLLRSGIAPRWTGWLAIGAAALNLIGSATLVDGTVFPALGLATLLFDLWTIALCVALLRGSTARPAIRRQPVALRS